MRYYINIYLNLYWYEREWKDKKNNRRCIYKIYIYSTSIFTHLCTYSRLWIHLFVVHISIYSYTHTHVWTYHATPFSSCIPSYPLLFHSYIRISTRAKAYVRSRPRCGLGQHMRTLFFLLVCVHFLARETTRTHAENASMNYRPRVAFPPIVHRRDERFTGVHAHDTAVKCDNFDISSDMYLILSLR